MKFKIGAITGTRNGPWSNKKVHKKTPPSKKNKHTIRTNQPNLYHSGKINDTPAPSRLLQRTPLNILLQFLLLRRRCFHFYLRGKC